MNIHEQFALNHYLASWPEGMTFDQVLNLMENGTGENDEPEIDLIADYEDLYHDHVAQLIRELHDDLVRTYQPFVTSCQQSLRLLEDPEADYFEANKVEAMLVQTLGGTP